MKLHVDLGNNAYDIHIERGLLSRAGELLALSRRVAIITDTGVPAAYAKAVAAQCRRPLIITVPEGESGKSLDSFTSIQKQLLDAHFTRSDAIVAVGGGVCGDLAGFCAATYMRGIDFYNIPTTLLSQVDSSVGGKTAVNLAGYKNMIGSFYQPKAVLIDPDVLSTLPPRQLACGMAEVIKMAATRDAALFASLEEGEPYHNIEEIIHRALSVKAAVVAADEREADLRKVLNFGHTIGHAIEHLYGEKESDPALHLYHGECVSVGMLPLCEGETKARVAALLKKYALPTLPPPWQNGVPAGMADTLTSAVLHDKKATGDSVSFVFCPRIGEFRFEKRGEAQISAMIADWLSQF